MTFLERTVNGQLELVAQKLRLWTAA